MRGAAGGEAARLFLLLLRADERFERGLRGSRLLVELVDLGLDDLALRVGGGEQLRALACQAVEGQPLLLHLR